MTDTTTITTPDAEALLGVTRARLYQLAAQHPGLKLGRSRWDAGIVATLAEARAQRREATAVLKGGTTPVETAGTPPPLDTEGQTC